MMNISNYITCTHTHRQVLLHVQERRDQRLNTQLLHLHTELSETRAVSVRHSTGERVLIHRCVCVCVTDRGTSILLCWLMAVVSWQPQ